MKASVKMLLAAATVAIFASTSVLAATPSGKITRVQGDVKVVRGSSSSPARVGAPVYAGNLIQTGPGARAKLLMSDGTMLNVAPGSKIRIKSYVHNTQTGQRTADYDLVYGRGRAKIPKAAPGAQSPNIRFNTPTAVAGVRGTEIIFEYDPATGQTRIIVVEGSVTIPNPADPNNPIVLTEGMGTTVGANMVPTTPIQVPASEIEAIRQNAQGGNPTPNDTNNDVQTDGQGDNITAPPPPETITTIVTTDDGGFEGDGNDGVVGSPEDLIDQEPPPFTSVIINIYLN